jgi:hypothetical protein
MEEQNEWWKRNENLKESGSYLKLKPCVYEQTIIPAIKAANGIAICAIAL